MNLINIKWEYKVLPNLTEEGMNLLGADGWELVNIIQSVHHEGWVCLMKRMVVDEQYDEYEDAITISKKEYEHLKQCQERLIAQHTIKTEVVMNERFGINTIVNNQEEEL